MKRLVEEAPHKGLCGGHSWSERSRMRWQVEQHPHILRMRRSQGKSQEEDFTRREKGEELRKPQESSEEQGSRKESEQRHPACLVQHGLQPLKSVDI